MATLEIDRYILETLMPDLIGHDRRPSAFIVYLALWHLADGGRDATVAASLRGLAEATGLSKRAVQTAIARLVRRRLITVSRANTTAIPAYRVLRPWARRKSG